MFSNAFKVLGLTALAIQTRGQATEQSSTNWLDMESAVGNENLDWGLESHGCNCPAVYGSFAIGGTSVADDKVDAVCQNFRQCSTCAAKDTNCGTAYETTSFNWKNSFNGTKAECVNNVAGSCSALKCDCFITFVNEMEALGAGVINATTVNATAATAADCTQAPGSARSCCKNAAGEWKMFNDAAQKCENGEIVAAGLVPIVKSCNKKIVDVTLFVDGSGSVGFANFRDAVIPFCKDFAAALQLSSDGVQMQFIQWGSYATLEFGYQTDTATFQTLADGVISNYMSSGTYTVENLEWAYVNHIRNKGRAGARQVIVNITDGKPANDTNGDKVRNYVANTLTPAGVVHLVVGIGTGIPWSTLVNMSTIKNSAVHNGETTFLVGLNLNDMASIGDEVGKEVCRV